MSPWAKKAASAQASGVAGELLTFAKGKWRIGENKLTPSPDLRLVANMLEMWEGFVKWEDGKPVDTRLARIDTPSIKRDDLGDSDETEWPIDDQGNAVDVWQHTTRLILRDLRDASKLYTFSTSSQGGNKGVGALCGLYELERVKREGLYPVVKLAVGTMKSKRYGEIDFPRFEVVDWASWDGTPPRKQLAAKTPDDPRTMVDDVPPPASEDDYGVAA
jgi:hypothetical protein